MKRILLAILAAVLTSLSVAQAQMMPPPGQGPAPLLFVRFAGPAGMHVTFYQGRTVPRRLTAPVTVGLRPGYVYRIKLSDIPDRPGMEFFPTLEARGTLQLPPALHAADYPVPFVLSDLDIGRIVASSMLSKVVYLEDPERAVISTVRPGEPPMEMELGASRDLLNEAKELGRPMLIWRVGGRQVSEAELVMQSIPYTILFPGEKGLLPPPVAPFLPWRCASFYDPLSGPRPGTEECLHDGGDVGNPVGFDRNGQLQGLDPSDTVAEYTDAAGRRHVTCSNRVCLCVPRFAVLRCELPLAGAEGAIGLARTASIETQAFASSRIPSLWSVQNEQVGQFKGRERPSGTRNTEGLLIEAHVCVLEATLLNVGPVALIGTQFMQQLTQEQRTLFLRQIELAQQLNQHTGVGAVSQKEGTTVTGKVCGLEVVASAMTTRDFTVCCKEMPTIPDKPLLLCKWVNTQAAQVGDVVTFYLKYSNLGGRPINDVVVSDSLTGRLEYVNGSAKSDRNTVFTMQQNEAGSLILRWEVNGTLQSGESGIVTFQARVR